MTLYRNGLFLDVFIRLQSCAVPGGDGQTFRCSLILLGDITLCYLDMPLAQGRSGVSILS